MVRVNANHRERRGRIDSRVRNRPDHDNRYRNRRRTLYYREYETNSINTYELAITEGPTTLCACCGGLFFLKSIRFYSEETLLELIGPELLIAICQIPSGEAIQLCITCDRDISKGKIPRLSLANGLSFPAIPPELQGLSVLEERLVSPRIPFMQIRELGVDKQYGIRGNVVNVPIEIDTCMVCLPRTFDRTETVQLYLKRMRSHKSNYLTDTVRPSVVMSAARYLAQQPLYQEEGIVLSENWHNIYTQESVSFVADPSDPTIGNDTDTGEEDNWDETNEQDIAPGGEETLIKQNIVFAPGEGVRPISLLGDEFAEELAFPTKFCGQKRQLNPAVKLSLTDIQKSELRRFDRRSVKVAIIFYMLRMKEALALKNAINIHMRMGSQRQGLSAGQILNTDIIDQFLQSDEAYKVLVQDRSSPPYWQAKLRDTMAMIAQLGPPDFFLTLSASETRWPELLVILAKVLENRSITEDEAKGMTYPEKCDLIRRDPVTCSRYFDHRFRELFKLLKSSDGPFGEYKLVDWYVRIEFQHRGSPHAHCLLWLEGAPKFDPAVPQSRTACEIFIERFTSCATNDPELEGLVPLQYHKHSKSCRRFKNDSPICRFGVPHFPMSKTRILDPLDPDSLAQKQLVLLEDILERIEDKIVEFDSNCRQNSAENHSDFATFLRDLQITEETYILAIRLTLKRSAVFISRRPIELRINGYNRDILLRHRANMDIQFILDPYACVHYMLNYINKANRGMSALLRHVVDECKSGYVSQQQKLYRVGSTFLNCSEISAQEAVYILLSMPLSISSRSTVFINTGEPEKRTKVLKSRAELMEMDPDSDDIMVAGLLEQYPQRPDELETVCLAEFAAQYNVSKTKTQPQVLDSDGNNIDSQISIPKSALKLKDGKAWVVKRRRPRVIRFRKYSFDKDPENYFREKAMLFIPWRSESLELLGNDCRQLCIANKDIILLRERQYRHNPNTDYDQIRDDIEKQSIAEVEQVPDEVALDHQVLDLQRIDTSIGDEFGGSASNNNSNKSSFLGAPKLTNDAYADLIRNLNLRQRQYLLGTMNLVKTATKPIYHFVTGGAGTGKSVLISALFQAMTRYYEFKSQVSDKVTVALLASTGKAAHNIGGTTIHAFLGITVSANNKLQILSADTKNTLRTRLWHLKALIIDEISMVGAATFRKIDNQLKQIFDSKEAFGGISIFAFGDFNQLRPVMDRYLFEDMPGTDHSVLAGPILWRLFKIYRLTEIMRQKDDLSFATALNNLATGAVTVEDRHLLETRLFDRASTDIPAKAIRLFSQNAQVDRYNRKSIVESNEICFESMANDFTTAGLSRQIREKALYSVSFLQTKDTYGLPKVVLLKKDIRYMITNNLDIADGLVNGSTGVLRDIDLISVNGSLTPQTLWVEFESVRVGMNARSKAKPRLYTGKYLTPIGRATRDIRTKCGNSFVLVSRQQFPVVPAEAITIHKAQGQTYEEVVVDVSRTLQLSQLYTALSRAKTSNGLYLIGAKLQDIKVRTENDRCVRELARMETESTFTPTRSSDIEVDRRSLKVVFHNFPHLAKHVKDIVAGPEYMAADILIFAETRSFDVHLPGFRLVAILQPQDKRPFGMAVYAKQDSPIQFDNVIAEVVVFKGAHIEYMAFTIVKLAILAVYVSPGLPKSIAIQRLAEICESLMSVSPNILVLGDMNININENIGQSLIERFATIGLKSVLPFGTPSNDFGNQIDLAFSSIPVMFADYCESLLSDHKLIQLFI